MELAFDELKPHQRDPRVVRRSKTPEGVLQEVDGLLLTHRPRPRRGRPCTKFAPLSSPSE